MGATRIFLKTKLSYLTANSCVNHALILFQKPQNSKIAHVTMTASICWWFVVLSSLLLIKNLKTVASAIPEI